MARAHGQDVLLKELVSFSFFSLKIFKGFCKRIALSTKMLVGVSIKASLRLQSGSASGHPGRHFRREESHPFSSAWR